MSIFNKHNGLDEEVVESSQDPGLVFEQHALRGSVEDFAAMKKKLEEEQAQERELLQKEHQEAELRLNAERELKEKHAREQQEFEGKVLEILRKNLPDTINLEHYMKKSDFHQAEENFNKLRVEFEDFSIDVLDLIGLIICKNTGKCDFNHDAA